MKSEIIKLLIAGCSILSSAEGYTQSKKVVTDPVFTTVANKKGPVLAYAKTSGVKILTVQGLHFKDLNKNGKLDPYEDWRLSVEERAKDLASKMTNEEIAGLMLYGDHQDIDSSNLSEVHKKFLKKNHLRHILISAVKSPEIAAQWSNHMQAFVEGLHLGIPGNNSSDPRNAAEGTEGINGGAGGTISLWPEALGMAATFDPALVASFGRIAAQEYRALGITTALSPQIDLATEPRWFRFPGTFGEDPQLTTDMARAYIDGFQTSNGKNEIKGGWGYASVNAMVKHWPGGGPVESGRDAHFSFGKYAVYPGHNFLAHLAPFLNGAFKLSGKTQKASAVMPYYTIPFEQDTLYGENVGNNFSKYIVTDLLRNQYGYNGVICTDWHVTGGRKWGVEQLTLVERFYKLLNAGVDQIGGVNEIDPLLKAFEKAVKEHGEQWLRERIEASAVRLLRNIFQVGLFENPYLDPKASAQIVGNPQFVKAGYEAQLKSIVLLKNKDRALPIQKDRRVYIPKIHTPAGKDPLGKVIPEKYDYPVNIELVKKYFSVTDDPSNADVAIVFVKGPDGGVGYDRTNGLGYVPISLQYGPYTAENARAQSIASDDPADPINTNRSYKGKTITASNSADLKTILDTKAAMGFKPVIVSMALTNPAIVAEFEKEVQGIMVSFGVQPRALLDILSGVVQPSGLLPMQMPANMKTVEEQKEDVPHDMECYVDSEGHPYDFCYGLNWKGVISDFRTAKYKKLSNYLLSKNSKK
jgi:beta-glucosidase